MNIAIAIVVVLVIIVLGYLGYRYSEIQRELTFENTLINEHKDRIKKNIADAKMSRTSAEAQVKKLQSQYNTDSEQIDELTKQYRDTMDKFKEQDAIMKDQTIVKDQQHNKMLEYQAQLADAEKRRKMAIDSKNKVDENKALDDQKKLNALITSSRKEEQSANMAVFTAHKERTMHYYAYTAIMKKITNLKDDVKNINTSLDAANLVLTHAHEAIVNNQTELDHYNTNTEQIIADIQVGKGLPETQADAYNAYLEKQNQATTPATEESFSPY